MKKSSIAFLLGVLLSTLSFVSSLQASSFVLTGPMNFGRLYHTATLLQNGKILVAGGAVGLFEVTANAEIYDPTTGIWTVTQPMHAARFSHTATLLSNGKVLVVGGIFDSDNQASASAELYDPASGTWTMINPMNVARFGNVAALLGNGKVLVAGGESANFGSGIASSELYDPTSGNWTLTGVMPTNFVGSVATILANGRVLVTGGWVLDAAFNQESIPYTSLYDPTTGTWAAQGQLINRRYAHTATLLPNGKVMVAGGNDISSNQNLAGAELYDPNTGNWTATGMLNVSRSLHTATLLISGKVLVTGGQTNAVGAELYDPSSGTWSATATMNDPNRILHTATLLPNGTVLIAGDGSISLGDSEIYLPISGSVKVTISPTAVISAGAQWQVDGGAFLDSGTVVSNLLGGSHTISFKNTFGWVTPSAQLITISDNATNVVSGTYIEKPGALQVNLSPAGVVSIGAQWSVDGGAFFNSGAIVTNLSAGSHTVAFKNIFGWMTPAAQLTSISGDFTNVVSGTYIEEPGAVQVNLNPSGAVGAGAQWSVDGGAFLNSGALATNLSAGSHAISFKNITGWSAPSAQAISISDGITNVVSGTYVPDPGALRVNLTPSGAVSAGAQWQVDGGTFQNSGALLGNVSAGSHLISFQTIPGWVTPASQNVNVNSDLTNILSGVYGLLPGATTLPPGNFTGTTVTLNGSISPNGLPTTVYYQYGPIACTNFVSTAVVLSNNLNVTQMVPIVITGLLPGPTDQVQMVASNSVGISFGSVIVFSWPGVIDTNQYDIQTVTWNRNALGQTISGFCCANGPQAVSYTWPNNNNWSQAFQFIPDPCGDLIVNRPSNWGTNNPPNGTNYNVIVGSLGGAPVNLDIDVTVNSFVLQAGGGLNITQTGLAANLFDFQGDFNITTPGSGRLSILSGGRLMKSSGTNSLAFDPLISLSANNATLEADSGTLILPGRSSTYSNCMFNAVSGAILQFMPTNQGGVQATLAGISTGAGGGVVLFNSGLLNADPSGSTLNFPGPLFVWTGGSISVDSVTMTNLGVINIQGTNGPQVIRTGTFLNQGTMENLDTNALIVNGIFTSIVNDANGIYDLAADGGISGPGTFYNYGLLRKSGGTNTSTIGLILDNLGGTIDVESGNLVLAGSDRSSSNGTVHVNANATLDLTGGRNVTWAGTLTGTGAGQVLLSSGRLQSSGWVSLNLAGSLFLWTGGTIDLNSGSITNLGVINVKGVNAPQVLGVGGFYNAGLMTNLDTNGLTIASFGGSIENLPGGTYDFATDGGIAGFGHFYNDGLVRKDGGTNLTVISPTFNNQGGSIEVDMGTLSLSGPFDQGGGTMTFRLNGLAPGQSGQLLDSSTVTLGGALKVSFADTFAPPIGSQFQLVSCSSRIGNFSAVSLPVGTMVTYSNAGVFLVVTSAVPAHIISPIIAGTNFLFSVPTISGQSYTVQKTDDLVTTNWTFYTNFTGSGDLYEFITPVTNVAKRFFRIREP